MLILSKALVNLPDSWPDENLDLASFRYTHPHNPNEEFYFKFLPVNDGRTLEINCLSSIRNDEIINTEF